MAYKKWANAPKSLPAPDGARRTAFPERDDRRLQHYAAFPRPVLREGAQ